MRIVIGKKRQNSETLNKKITNKYLKELGEYMSDEGKTNTEGGSFAEPTPEEKQTTPVPPTKPEEETVFTYLKQIVDAIQAKNAQTAHHLDRIATALEKISKRGDEDLKKAPMSTSMPVPITPIPKPVTSAPAPTPVPTSTPTPASSFMNTVKASFPNELANMLIFSEDKVGIVIIKPRQFLGSENFAKIVSIVRSINGEYVSAGKESHFRVVSKK